MSAAVRIPADYAQRVYAGVLGKIIGVFLGRPFEGWSYEKIMAELGPINYYVHDRLDKPLIVSDDDISGTFTFLRALEDHGISPDLTAEQIGQTWMNYIIEDRTILWWGGMGMSTEHTAFLRMKQGIPAPRSGSIALNTKVVAEQIGAQIFIDGWAMVAPGAPALAADLATKAASVSHDGEAIYGAVVVAVIESAAFYEKDINKLIDLAVTFIPKDSVIFRMIADLRAWHKKEPNWEKARELLAANYGYDKYGGNCHMVPNHGVIILALLWGEDDFQKSLMIANTAGWDTDCNSGNVGCIMGIKNGLAAIDTGPDWRHPVADQMFLPTADGGRCITDAVYETLRIVNMGRTLAGQVPIKPKSGARFHFCFPGCQQGFLGEEDSTESRGVIDRIGAAQRQGQSENDLLFSYHGLAAGRFARIETRTFFTPDLVNRVGYGMFGCPTLYPGQTVVAHVGKVAEQPSSGQVSARLFIRVYAGGDKLVHVFGPAVPLTSAAQELSWTVPDTGGQPIAFVGVELSSQQGGTYGTAFIESLTWSGTPKLTLRVPKEGGTLWRGAWVNGCDKVLADVEGQTFRLIHNVGRGLFIHGTRDWTDYCVTATITPHMIRSAGLALRVQGMRRFYALLLSEGGAKLIKMRDVETTLAQAPCAWEVTRPSRLRLQGRGANIKAWVDDRLLFDVTDKKEPLLDGAIGLVVEEGRMLSGEVCVEPV